jgi:hypothetical protein
VYRRENGRWTIVHRHGDHLTEAPLSSLAESSFAQSSFAQSSP